MPWRSRLMASTRSSRSVVSAVCWASTSRSSSSARRLTAPSRSRSRRSFSRFSSISASGGSSAPGSISARPATACGSNSSMSWISRSMSARRRLVPSMRSSARARGLARAGERFERNLGGAVGLRHQGFGGGERVGCGAGGPSRQCSISLISALRFSANNAGALSSFARSAVTSVTRGLDGRDLRRRALLAVLPFVALGEDRLHAAVGKFGLARQRLRFGADLGCEPAMAVDLGADGGELGLGLEARPAIRPARRWRSRCAASASVRSAVRRLRASVSAERRAAWRLISRSVAAWRSRAASASRWAARQASRAAVSAADGGLLLGFRGLQRLPLGGGIEARLLEFVLDIDEARALGEPPRRAGRRMGGGDKAVPAPDVAFQRHQPLAGLELRHELGAAFLGDDADLRQTARQFGRGLHMVGKRLDAVGQRRIAVGWRRRWSSASARTGSTGASRSSPSAAPIAFS